jgi:hypothetical protein
MPFLFLVVLAVDNSGGDRRALARIEIAVLKDRSRYFLAHT